VAVRVFVCIELGLEYRVRRKSYDSDGDGRLSQFFSHVMRLKAAHDTGGPGQVIAYHCTGSSAAVYHFAKHQTTRPYPLTESAEGC